MPCVLSRLERATWPWELKPAKELAKERSRADTPFRYPAGDSHTWAVLESLQRLSWEVCGF